MSNTLLYLFKFAGNCCEAIISRVGSHIWSIRVEGCYQHGPAAEGNTNVPSTLLARCKLYFGMTLVCV